jgi:ribonuclease HI
LQAELVALQLAMEIAKFFNFAGTSFLTDNSVIADTIKKRDFNNEPGH